MVHCDRLRLFEVIEICANLKLICDFRLMFYCNYMPMFYRFLDSMIYWSKIYVIRRFYPPQSRLKPSQEVPLSLKGCL